MKIDITNPEYRTLLDMLSLADWVLHAFVAPTDNDKYSAFFEKMLSLAKSFDCEDLVVFDKQKQKYFPSGEFETSEQIMDVIESYNNDTFWEELVGRLAERDLIREIGEERFMQLEPEERVLQIGRKEERYAKEFEKNGIETLTIK